MFQRSERNETKRKRRCSVRTDRKIKIWSDCIDERVFVETKRVDNPVIDVIGMSFKGRVWYLLICMFMDGIKQFVISGCLNEYGEYFEDKVKVIVV